MHTQEKVIKKSIVYKERTINDNNIGNKYF